MANRLRNKTVKFMLTEDEHRLYKQKLAELGVRDAGAFLRHMFFKGHYIQVDTRELSATCTPMEQLVCNLHSSTPACTARRRCVGEASERGSD